MITTAKKRSASDRTGEGRRPDRRMTALWGSLLALFVLFHAGAVHAAGTVAGTSITNSVTVNYTMGASSHTVSSTNTFRVDAVLNCTVTWQDAQPVSVSPGQTGRVLTMRLTNAGNGTDSYTLSAISTQVTGTDFTPGSIALYLDSNGDNGYTAGTDAAYVPGVNDPSLGPDLGLTVFILSAIPGTGIADGQKGNVQLTATSKTGTGPAGTVLSGKGPGGTDAIVGLSGGVSSDTGSYIASSITVNVNKTQTVSDQYGGTLPITGATIRYTLTVTATGSGTASNVVVSDPIPAGTTYTAGSLRLDGNALTDAADADAGDVNATSAGTATVRLPGSLTSASPAQTIIFEVKID